MTSHQNLYPEAELEEPPKTLDLSKAERFWRDLLEGFTAPTRLAAARPSPSERGRAEIRGRLSDDITHALLGLATQNGFTLNTILQGAWALLLVRYSNQNDVVFGVTRTRRISTPGSSDAMNGLFINPVPARVRLSQDDLLIPWLKALRSQRTAARDYEQTPLFLIQRWSQWSEEALLFESLVAFENHSLNRELSLPQASNFPLALRAFPESGLRMRLEYDRNQFSEGLATRILEDLQTILQAMAADPDRRAQELEILNPAQRRQILVEYNDTLRIFPGDGLIHEMFERQASLTPDSTAAVFGEEHLSYGRLNADANRLAHYLKDLGAGPEKLIGICLERGVELPISILATMKSGAAYLPLDPTYPAERLAYMSEDSDVKVILSRRGVSSLSSLGNVRLVCLDSEAREIDIRSDANPGCAANRENAAYVIYTSGSTGGPKGVVIRHKSVTNLFGALKESIYGLAPPGQLRVSLNGPVTFDTSVKQFIQLAAGHALHIVSERERENPDQLLSFLAEHSLDIFDCTPSMLGLLIKRGLLKQDRMPALILLGGEPIDKATWKLLASTEKRPFVNVYGPTECTVNATTHHITEPEETSVIGRPIANVKLYLLDNLLRPVPKGVTGELYIAGEAVRGGYLRRPALTAEKYLPNPYSSLPGERMYRTNDLCRWLEGGRIEYLARNDDLLKTYGRRIEPGEIEELLNSYEGVAKSVVVMREDVPGNKRLIAYVACDDERLAPRPIDLLNHLRLKLPEFMIPSAFMTLSSLPLTANGKLDRGALPAPTPIQRELDDSYVGPRNAIEGLLADIWSEALDVEHVGVEDNLFVMGGHSIICMRILARIRQVLQVEIALRDLFQAPTVAALARLVEKARSSAQPPDVSTIKPAPRREKMLLSSAQERLWFLDQLRPGGSVYNIPTATRLRGTLNLPALEQSLGEIVRRHEALRVRFEVDEGGPVQLIASGLGATISVVDLNLDQTSARESAARTLIAMDAARPFDLSQGPTLRARLATMGDGEHMLLLTMHHITGDGWSMRILARELERLYEAFSQGEQSPLEDLSIQYGDYAVWERERLESEAVREQLNYWRQCLGSDLEPLELPADHARPAFQSDRGARQSVIIDRESVEQLKRLSREVGVTLFMTLMASFKALLARYSGQQHVIVGTPIAGRNYAEVEGLIGLFVNTLALKTDLAGDPDFKELLVREREAALAAYSNQEAPFDKVVEAARPERDLSQAPLIQAMFALQNTLKQDFSLRGIQAQPLAIERTTTHFELNLMLTENEQCLRGLMEYSVDLFEDATISRLLDHFENLLAGVIVDPGRRLSELPLMSEKERRQALFDWNLTADAYERDSSLKALFEIQAARTPDRVAVVYNAEQLTYLELNRRANQLADTLRSRGVRADAVVGVCMERSIEMLIGLVGVLKAGGAYLPLDAGYPPDRLQYMLDQTRVEVLLTQDALVRLLPEYGGEIIRLDGQWSDIARRRDDNADVEPDSDNLAYVMYTSGSTGRPKGVAVTHRNVARLVRQNRYASLTTEEIILQFAPISFDASTFEIWGALLNGARLEVYRAGATALEDLGKEIYERGVTTLWLTADLFHHMVNDHLEKLKTLRQLLAGGDALSAPHVKQAAEELRGCRVINGYGPTEATTFSSSYEAQAGEKMERGTPIGFPIANTQIHIEGGKEPAPIGVVGEVLIGGDGLARGYMNRPDLTAEKFAPDHYGDAPGARLYRTGDLGRRGVRGEIEYLGRADSQVKIRGYRIELGEIERAMDEHTGVVVAVAMAQKDDAGEKRLVAYVVRKESAGVDAAVLRDYLRGKLPAYMVPSAFVFLDRMPQTSNGKIDRRALPAAPLDAFQNGRCYAAPRNPTEEIVSGVWGDVLGLDHVGADDDFFALGGHSLKATRIISRLRKAFGADLPVSVIFESPTVAELARTIETVLQAKQDVSAPPIIRISRDTPIPVSFAQHRLYFLDQMNSGAPVYNVPFAVRLAGSLNIAALEYGLNQIFKRHETLRSRFEVDGDLPIQIISAPVQISIPQVDLERIAPRAREDEATRIMSRLAAIPFDLRRGNLFRAVLIRIDEADHALMLLAHHINFDGWSYGVFLRELTAFYKERLTGESPGLPDLPIQYPDYAHWQREWLQGEVLGKHLEYWKQRLRGNVALNLPVDHPAPATQIQTAARRLIMTPKVLLVELKEISRREGATLFMTLLTVFQVLLSRWTGQEDISVGAVVAGRDRQEIENLIGFFVNTLVMRSDLSGNPTFVEALGRVRETALGAYAHQDVPFEKVVQALRPKRQSNHNPLFQVMFSLERPQWDELDLNDLKVSRMRLSSESNKAAKFDLNLSMSETERGLAAALTYKRGLFNETTIERFMNTLRRLLESVAANPQQRILEITLFDESSNDWQMNEEEEE